MDEIGNFYQKTATPILLTLSCKILPHERCNLGAKEFDRLENLLMRKRSQRQMQHEAVQSQLLYHLDQFLSDMFRATDKHGTLWSYLIQVLLIGHLPPVRAVLRDSVHYLLGRMEVSPDRLLIILHDPAPRVGSDLQLFI